MGFSLEFSLKIEFKLRVKLHFHLASAGNRMNFGSKKSLELLSLLWNIDIV